MLFFYSQLHEAITMRFKPNYPIASNPKNPSMLVLHHVLCFMHSNKCSYQAEKVRYNHNLLSNSALPSIGGTLNAAGLRCIASAGNK
jgi:hypothetical protein